MITNICLTNNIKCAGYCNGECISVENCMHKDAIKEFKAGDIVRHFKGNFYIIVTTAINTETEEKEVVYKALYGSGKVWARPYKMFYSKVPKNKNNPTGQIYRFDKCKIENKSK